jgi:hypothetical protein
MTCVPVTPFALGATRIPIAGPKPFNTLVYCQSLQTAVIGDTQKVRRGQILAESNYTIPNYDQRLRPVFRHTTSAWINAIGPGDDGTWLCAIDSIDDAGFDPITGRFWVLYSVARLFTRRPNYTGFLNESNFLALSYVLVREPPIQGILAPEPLAQPGALHSLSSG